MLDGKENHDNFIRKIMNTLLLLLFSSYLLFTKLFANTLYLGSVGKTSLIIFSIFVVFVTIIIMYRKNHTFINFRDKKDIALASMVIVFMLSQYFILDEVITYILSLSIFAISHLHLFSSCVRKKYKGEIIGLILMSFALVMILTMNLLFKFIPLELVVASTFGLQVLSAIGLMIFFSSNFNMKMTESNRKLQNKNKELNEIYVHFRNSVLVDSITQLNNKVSFLEMAKYNDTYQSIALINIRNFLNINQIHGFQYGNSILRSFGVELKRWHGKHGDVYRFDSDQFLVCSVENANDLKTRLINRKIEILNCEIPIHYYAGVSNRVKHYDLFEALNMLEYVTQRAKDEKNNVLLLSENEYNQSKEDADMLLNLKKAISDKVFTVHYQPKYSPIDETIVSYEALARWYDKEKYISPAIFIPLAEKEGLIDNIAVSIIKQVFRDMSSNWHKGKCISINLTVMELLDENFLQFIIDTARIYDVEPSEVTLEVTESMFDYDMYHLKQSIDLLKANGFKISLDDFGSGASSLYRFAKLDFDEIKFDKSFVSEMMTDEKVMTTFTKSVELFKAYNMNIVAEGVETIDQLNFLKTLPIDQIQGYYFSKPLPLDKVMVL